MKQPKRILAYSALALIVMLAAFGAIAFDTSNVALAQSVPQAPTLTAQASGASTINLSWNSVPDAASYELWAWDNVNEWQRLDGGDTNPLTATTFAHTGLTSGTTYYYQVRAINSSGGVSAWSDRVNEVAGTTAPARPVLTATPGYLQITVSWPAVPGASTYELWAWDNSWTRLDDGTLSATSHTHSGLTAGRTYYYQARATSSSNVMSAWSAQVSAVVLSSPNISAPTSFTAARGDQMITLNWGAPASVAGLTLAGYEYRYAASGTALPATWTNVGNVTTTSVSGLTNGMTYNFELRAVSTTDAKGDVATASGTPSTMASAPTLSAAPGYRHIVLTWTAPTSNGGAPVTGYRIERQNTDGSWATRNNPPGNVLTWTDRGLSDSVQYTYRIFAVNAAGDSDWTSATALTLANPPAVPSAPTGVTAVAGAGKVDLSWNAPAFNGGAPILDYQYQFKETVGGTYGRWNDVGDVTMVEVPNLMPGTAYTFAVRARNSVGRGPSGESASVTPTATGPTAVPVLRAILGEDDQDPPNDQITLTWNALGPAQNGGSAITGYEICYKESDDDDWMRWDSADGGFTAPTANDSGQVWTAVHGDATDNLDPGTTYQYRARALNAFALAGTADTCTHWDGDWSNVASASTAPIAPEVAPTLLASDDADNPWVIEITSITVKWTAPATDGGSDITGYELWVGLATSPDADNDDRDPVILNLPATRTEFKHVGLRATTAYFYRVRAMNSVGESPWSAEVSATTSASAPGTPGAPGSPKAAHSEGTVTFSWTTPKDSGTLPITGYEVQYQRDDDDSDSDWTDATTVTISSPNTLRFVHENVEGGAAVNWEYRVRAVNGNGGGAWTADDGVQVQVPARAPSAPMLTASAISDTEILLEWNVPQNNGTPITGFEVQQWDGTSAYGSDLLDGDADTPTTTAFTVGMLTGGTEYFFRVRAAPGGEWSGDTEDNSTTGAASATTMTGVPGAPTLTLGTGDDEPTHNTLAFTWKAPSDGGSDITGYQVQIWDDTSSSWMAEATLEEDVLEYEDEDLASSTRYYYRVSAVNMQGAGPWSAFLTAATTGGNPDAPMLSATALSGSSIRLSWNVPDNNGTPITGYDLRRWNPETGTDGDWGATNLLAANVTVTEFVDTDGKTGLTAGTKYYYRIRALPQNVDTAGSAKGTDDEGWSADDMMDAASATTHGDVPAQPALTVGTETANTVPLTWTAPNAGGAPISSYELRIWNSATNMWDLEDEKMAMDDEVAGTTSYSYTDMNLAAGTRYYYILRAKNSQGNGPWSAFVTADTKAGAMPDAPVLMATPAGTDSIRLTWTIPNDNGVDITGYEIEFWDVTPTPDAWADEVTLTNADQTLHIDTMLMAGTTYYYRIRATASTPSDWSTQATATTVAAAPGRPQNVMAAADGQNAIDLSWDAPASDGGNAIIHYQIEVWDSTSRSWTRVSVISATSTTFKHRGLSAGTRYVYRVRAVNRAPTNNGLGLWSTVTSGTTAAAE